MKTVRRISILFLCVIMLGNVGLLHVEAKTNIKLNKTKVNLSVGKSTTLKLEQSKVEKWTTSNKKIATVSSKGKVTGKKKGTATITAKATNGNSYKCTVTVKEISREQECINIIEKTLKENGFVKTTEYMTAEELEEWGPTAGCGWGDVEINMSNPQQYADEIVNFMNTCGYKMFYLENLDSSNGVMTIRVYNG